MSQRKILSILTIVLALTNCPISAVYAADPTTSVVQTTVSSPMSVTTPAVDAPATVTTPPTVQDVLLSVCTSNGYGQDCAKTLLGMLWNESSNVYNVIGDHGAARGYFQIHYKLHKVSIDCAEDLVCSANWTLNYMESHSYPRYVSYAVQCHNSCNVNNGYAAKAFRNGNYFWSQPLAVIQAAPIATTPTILAMK